MIIISELIKYARNVAAAKKKDGFIGGRIPKYLEMEFKDYIEGLGLSQAEALQILIEKELDNRGAGVSKTASHIDSSPVVAPAKSLPENKPVKAKPGNKKGSNRGAYDEYKRQDVNGSVVFPCPICGQWYQYSTFKNRHTKKHGYADHLHLFADHKDVLENMLKDWGK